MAEIKGNILKSCKFLYGPLCKSTGQTKYKFIYGYDSKKIVAFPVEKRLVFWYRRLHREKITVLNKQVKKITDAIHIENILKHSVDGINKEEISSLLSSYGYKYIIYDRKYTNFKRHVKKEIEEHASNMLSSKRLNEIYVSLCDNELSIDRMLDLITDHTEIFSKCSRVSDISVLDIIMLQISKEKSISASNDNILSKISNTVLKLDDITLKKSIIESIVEHEVQLYNPIEDIEVLKGTILDKIKIENMPFNDIEFKRTDVFMGEVDEFISFYKIVVRDLISNSTIDFERNIEGSYDGTDKKMIEISTSNKFKRWDYPIEVFEASVKIAKMDYDLFNLEEIYQFRKQPKRITKVDETYKIKRNIMHYFINANINMLTRVIEHELLNSDDIDMFDKMAKDLLEDGFNIAEIEKIHSKEILEENNDNRFKLITERILIKIYEIEKIRNITTKKILNDKERNLLAQIIVYKSLFEEVDNILKREVATNPISTSDNVQVTKEDKDVIINLADSTFNNIFRSLHVTDEQIQGFHDIAVQIDDDRELKLYTRFWIINNTDYKDLLILPDHDFPYSSEPIFEGGDERSENWDVVYPNKFYEQIDRHPISNGKYLAIDEIEVDINIMIEIINIFIMMWCKFTPAFWGWTGVQAVCGITDSIYEFLSLSTTIDKMRDNNVLEQYQRAYKWLRWEAEKTALLARHDSELRGNYYVDILLTNLINYMVDHHFDVMPLFKDVNKMDEWRTLFNKDINKDITWVLDKLKGIRHKILKE